MSTTIEPKTKLHELLKAIVKGDLQLPDFQRGWVWDDDHIQSLLVSIARSFPIGAVMVLQTGGEVTFQVRTVEGIDLPSGVEPEYLILDGQQRLTSLTQVLMLAAPVVTRNAKGQPLKRYYYFDIEKAMEGSASLSEAIVAVDEERMQRENFGRDVKLDLSTSDKEYELFHFPFNQILNSDSWESGLVVKRPDRLLRYHQFRESVLVPFREYMVTVMDLKKSTSKEAVCLIFEKVNTGGVPLSVFELVTASYAAHGFNLRTDWYGEKGSRGRSGRLTRHALLKGLEATEFLQGISLLHTYEKRRRDLAEGKSGKEVAAVSAKREHVLALPLEAYEKWSERLTNGFLEADKFLRHLGFFQHKFLPYSAQIIPLAAVLTHIGERWLEHQVQDKLSRWFWCGVFGELYGSASETRIALDLQNLLHWIEDDSAPEPATIVAAGFQASRLDTLRTRTSAAYRGLYVLLQQEGARDFFWKSRILDLDRNQINIDIHHIFPVKWSVDNGIRKNDYDSIVNKTAISYKANRIIGGRAPSEYLPMLQDHKAVGLSVDAMNDILRTHLIDPDLLRADDFDAFYQARRTALVKLIEGAMKKAVIDSDNGVIADIEATSSTQLI